MDRYLDGFVDDRYNYIGLDRYGEKAEKESRSTCKNQDIISSNLPISVTLYKTPQLFKAINTLSYLIL